MGIARTRHKGPTFVPRTKRMDCYIWDTGPSSNKHWARNPGGDIYYPHDAVSCATDYRLCNDELHRKRKGRWVDGGPFYLKKITLDIQPYAGDYRYGMYRYDGNLVTIAPTWTSLMSLLDAYYPTATSWGATGWNKFRPVKPTADMAQFLGELRDVPSMFKATLRKFKDLGSYYLNYRFGWTPFVRDIVKYIQTLQKIERRIAFARANNGKWIRRGGTISNSANSETSSVPVALATTLNTYFWPNTVPNPGTKVVTTTDRIWFSAVMRFWIPDLDTDPMDTVFNSAFLRKMYGLEINPSVLWELMPWSWFQDWFNNFGDVFANLSNSFYDNLVAKYAYVMRHRKVSTVISWEGPIKTDGGIKYAGPCTTKYSVEYKERGTASPYGFGQLGDDDLSLKQWAILAALGVSRMPF